MEIWEKIAEDPEEGARRLVSEYGNRLICVAEILCGEHAFAEDLVFVTFRKAIAKIASFDARYSFWNWLYTILLNEFRSTLRKKKAEVLDEKSQDASLLDGEDHATLNDLLARSDAHVIRRAVGALPAAFREVIALRYFEDKTLSEIVHVTGVPIGTIKWRLHEARRLLAGNLAGVLGLGKEKK